ncbi:MAG: hypothetical protein A2X28_08085 [Elusimicrobia bacterium GWA2_56_46]|nr:MAG: hypothetical protein A2X28_08085 [Elusimicrobia bacterium GWA2_56_46]OGR54285.1 MAG: hypothetical protein A2X39_03625 [Elusimicrobia bacterium GWC2_56_31]HBW22429.1 hypothetical protein [Elusimicrobiota bacterium]
MGKQATYSGYDKYETREEALGAQAALVDKFKQSGIPVLGSTVNQRYIDGKFRISVKYLAKVSVISKKVFSSDAYRAEADARADMAKNVSELKKAGCIINATKVVEGVDSDGLLYAFRIDYTEEKPTLLTDEYISKANTDQAAAVVEAIVGALSSKGVVVLESSSQPTPRVSYIAKDLDMWTLTSPQSRDIATAKADLAKQIADLRSRGALMVEAYLESVNSFMPPHSTAVFIRGDNMPEPKTIMVPAAEFDERLNQLKAENATILMIDRGIYSSVVYIPAK